jgi:hypothetical protein
MMWWPLKKTPATRIRTIGLGKDVMALDADAAKEIRAAAADVGALLA